MDKKTQNKICNKRFIPFLSDKHRYLVLCGGAGSGKSFFAGIKIIDRMMNEPGHKILVCRKVARTLRFSVFSQLRTQIAMYYPKEKIKISKSEPSITFENGNEIIFSGLDDVEKLKSIFGITGIWVEEASEIEESDFNQLDIRLRGKTNHYKQIILTFNPISSRHWLKKRFFDCKDRRAKTDISTYLDNRFLDAEARRTLENFKNTDEYYYRVYCLGKWGVTGNSIFGRGRVNEIIERAARPRQVGYFDIGRFYSGGDFFICAEDGFVKIYSPPQPGERYIIGADTAGTGSDFFVCQVISERSGEQAAVLRRQSFSEDEFTKQLFCLGEYYNKALIAVETDFSTYPVIELERLGYSNQYIRQSVDNFTGRSTSSYGFRTDAVTRPVIISELVRLVREAPRGFVDEETAEEMLTFCRNEKLRPEAERGCHDDCVMALAIACFIRSASLSYSAEEKNYPPQNWTRDMYEDYYNAGEEERAYLLRKWS